MYRARFLERRSTTAGFTIIEVLVALAVVAASLAAIGSLMATIMRGNRSVEQHIALVETVRAVEANLPNRDQLLAGDRSGEISGYFWRVQASAFSETGGREVDRSPWLPYHVIVTVRAPSGAVIRIDTVRLQRRVDG